MSLSVQEKKQQNKNNEHIFHKNNVLKVSDAAKILGISPSSLRRFEEEGRISSFRDPDNGYRYYRSDLVKELKKELEDSKNNLDIKIEKETELNASVKSPKQNNQVVQNNIEKSVNENVIKPPSDVKSIEEIGKSSNKPIKSGKPEYNDKNTAIEEKQIIQDFEGNLAGPLFRRTRSAVIFLSLFFVISLGLTFLSSRGLLKKFVNPGTGNISSILGLKTKQTDSTEKIKETFFPNVLATRTRVSDFVQNINLPTFFRQRATFEEGINVTDINFTDTATINGLLEIDGITKNTLEESLSIDGDVVGTNMLSTTIKKGVVDGAKLASEIEYEGSFDFLDESLLIDGTSIEATADEINYLSGMTVDQGGIFFGNGSGISQDPSLFWNTENNSLQIGNGSAFTGFRAPETLISDLIYSLPSQSGANDYVLSIHDNNALEWRDVTSLGGAGDITEVVAGDGLLGGGSSGSVTLNVVATNGLTSAVDAVKLGGSLTEDTTITQGNFDMTYNLTGTGDFDIQDGGVSMLYVGGSNDNVGIGTTNPSEQLDVLGGNIRTDLSLIASGVVLGYGEETGTTGRIGGAARFMTGTGYIYFDRNNSEVTMDKTTGDLSGYAFSDDLGWIDFGEDENPSGPVNVNLTSGSVTGKAYVLASGSYVDFTNYSSNVSVNLSTGVFSGYAWSEEAGWIDFSDTGVYFSNSTITTYAENQNLYINPRGNGATFISGNATIDGTVFADAFSSNSPLRLQTAGIDRIYINNSNGYVGIGTTDPTASLHVAGTLRFSNFGAGTLTTDASGNVSVSSDERLKDIQGSFDRGLEEILQLDPILYKWNGVSGMETETTYAGLSAQNVQSVIPEAVGVNSNGYLTLSDRPIIAATINAIKEQQIQIEELRNLLIDEGKILESTESSESLDIPTTDPAGILTEIQTIFEEFKEMILTIGMTSQTDESGNNYLSIDSDVMMMKDLNVLGDTMTSNLTVTGNLQAGTIEIDTVENSINVLGVSCYNEEMDETSEYCVEMTDQTLYLQKTLSGNLDVFNGKIVIEPNGTMKLDGNLEITGTVKSDTVETDTVIIKETKTPDIELGSQCKLGEMTWDQDYIYVCTSENTWSRSKLELIPGQSAVQQGIISGSTEPSSPF